MRKIVYLCLDKTQYVVYDEFVFLRHARTVYDRWARLEDNS